MANPLLQLIVKEFKIEYRQKYAINGILLFILGTAFIAYLSFTHFIEPKTWNALFWIILLFSALSGIAKSFIQDSDGQKLFNYILLNPKHVIASKLIYNIVLLICIAFLQLLIFTLFLGFPVQSKMQYVLGLLFGCIGIGATLTFISAIASKAQNSSALMAVLSLPVLLPLFITLLRQTRNSIDGIDFGINFKYLIIIVAIDLIVITLAYILFPYLWRE
ncbi:MAG: ABC transporter permease [Bacteroidia bacterium]|nr:heme exporter protein CcmB [Bacteroidia bacterium]NNC85744.1 ABC transporter permease [Bacteroidia bacterium]NNM16281.1 ABC transporter permease [Bacteroidia bacterium]